MKEPMMPSPEELNRIQKENLTDEQIEKDKIREETYEAGKMKGLQEVQQAHSAQDLRDQVEMMEVVLFNNIDKMIKKEKIRKHDKVKIVFKGGSSFSGEYHGLTFRKHTKEISTIEVISDFPSHEMQSFPLEKIESIEKGNMPLV